MDNTTTLFLGVFVVVLLLFLFFYVTEEKQVEKPPRTMNTAAASTPAVPKRVTLAVTHVPIPTKMAFPSRQSSKTIVSKILEEGQTLIDQGACSNAGEEENLVYRQPRQIHGMIDAMIKAFSEHYPLVLRPQQLWIVILQGISDHVNQNADYLQPRWMEGGKRDEAGKIQKKQLTVRRDDFVCDPDARNDWASIIVGGSSNGNMVSDLIQGRPNTFLGQIRQNIRSDAYADLLVEEENGLTNTTPIEKICMGITVMSTLQKYFDYRVLTMCGFPYIVLEGEREDWVKIRHAAEKLVRERCTAEFADRWLPALLPLLEKFIEEYEKGATGRGRPADSLFWNAMVKIGGRDGSGSYSWVTGWVNILFPYISGGKQSNRFAFEPYSENQAYVTVPHNKRFYLGDKNCIHGMGPDISGFSQGVSKVPVTWNYLGSNIELEFAAGFFGAKQDPETKEISPELMWCITNKPPEPKSFGIDEEELY